MNHKIEVEILAVGQGCCNVVKRIDTSILGGRLEYLAILDAGGDSTSTSPVKETMKKLMDYMKMRATAAGTTVQTNHYADLLVISHSDNDHYSIFKKILRQVDPNILGNEKSRKVVVILPKISEKNTFGVPGEDEDFAQVSYSMNPIKSGEKEGYIYAYCFQTDLCQGQDIYILRTFDEVTTFAYKEKLICGDKSVVCDQIDKDTFSITFNQWFSFIESGSTFYWQTLTVKNNNPCIDVAIEYKDQLPPGPWPFFGCPSKFFYCQVEKDLSLLTPDVIGILNFLCIRAVESMDFFMKKIRNFCEDIFQTLKTIGDIYGNSYYSPTTKESIIEKLGINSIYSAPTGNTLSFGKIVTSISNEKSSVDKKKAPLGCLPAVVGALARKAAAHDRLQGVQKLSIPSEQNAALKITLIGVPSDKEDFYQSEYKEKGGTYGSSDAMFRNMNSIITIVDVLSVGPHFIFPGDATVQNLWYNMNNNSGLLKGTGSNFFVLPHHGSYETSYGTVPSDSSSVFQKFLKLVDPRHMYISCGKENRHGHPNIWTMNECETYIAGRFPPLQEVKDNIVYYNQVNNSTKKYVYRKYPKPLYTTVSAWMDQSWGTNTYKVALPSYRITFEPCTAEHSKIDCVNTDSVVPASEIKDLAALRLTDYAIPEPLVNHPIYEFAFED